MSRVTMLNRSLVCDVRVGLWIAAGISTKEHTPQLHLSTPFQSRKMVQQSRSILVRKTVSFVLYLLPFDSSLGAKF